MPSLSLRSGKNRPNESTTQQSNPPKSPKAQDTQQQQQISQGGAPSNTTGSIKRPQPGSISSSFKNLFAKSPKFQPQGGETKISSPPRAISPTTILPDKNHKVIHQQPQQFDTLDNHSINPHRISEDIADTGFVPLSKPEQARVLSRRNSKAASVSRSGSIDGPTSRKGSSTSIGRKHSLIRVKHTEGNIKIYEDETHEHFLKPIKPQDKAPNSSGILSGFLRKNSNNNNDVAFSLLPEQNRMDFKRRLSIQSRRTFDEADEDNLDEDGRSIIDEESSSGSDDEDGASIEFSDEDHNEFYRTYSKRFSENAAVGENQLSLINKLVEKIDKNEDPSLGKGNYTLAEKYGKAQGIIGKGSYGIVKLVSKVDLSSKKDIYYAVKELKKKDNEAIEHFSTRLTSEFVISNSLNHSNIVKTVDLMRNSSGVYSEIMEYCAGGDLYTLISKTNREGLYYIEADCYMKQIINGICYMHSKGVAHCDIKPENILLTTNGVAKISDFGTSAVFRIAWEKDVHFSSGACGSEPYVAPEEFLDAEYDPRLVDVWAVGVLYLTMMAGTNVWGIAKDDDPLYVKYLDARPGTGKTGSFEPIENLTYGEIYKSRKQTLYGMLDPSIETRLTAFHVARTPWIKNVKLCEAAADSDYSY